MRAYAGESSKGGWQGTISILVACANIVHRHMLAKIIMSAEALSTIRALMGCSQKISS